MNRISFPLAAYLPLHRARMPRQSTDDIELGLIINAASHAHEASPTSESDPTDPCRLLTLPLELKTKIYGFVLIRSNKVAWQGAYMTESSPSHAKAQRYICNEPQDPDHFEADGNISALLLTCQTINREASALFYGDNDFVFKCRTPSPGHRLANFSPSSSSTRSHTLASGLPLAFANHVFRANAEHVTFVCAKPDHPLHSCGLEGVMRDDRAGEIGRSCPALKGLVMHEPPVTFWMRSRAERWGLGFVLAVVLALVCGAVGVAVWILVMAVSGGNGASSPTHT